MSKKPDPKPETTPAPQVNIVLMGLTREEGAFCLSTYEIPKDLFLKYCKRTSRTEPEIFAILNTQIIKKARELLEI